MPLKLEKLTEELVGIVEGCHSPPLSMVVASTLGASNTEEGFLRCLGYSLDKLSAEINVMQAQIEEINIT